MKPTFNLSWGDPVIVRQALTETLGRSFALLDTSLESLGYPEHYGSPKLIELLKDMSVRQTGSRPRHLFVTCGATGAINAAIWSLMGINTGFVVTNRRYFPIYPDIIVNHGLLHRYSGEDENITKNSSYSNQYMSLIDSPSNPEGLVSPFESVDVWDAAYASKTYSSGGHVPFNYKAMCGSLSKTLGLSGLRLGWAATNDDEIAKKLGQYVTSNYIGLSSLSMNVAEEVLNSLDLEQFETKSAGYLSDNREEMQKVLTKFGQGSVPARGMFAIVQLGKVERKALEKAGVKWQSGTSWGEIDDWARLSLGATRETIRNAVKAILK